MGSVIYPVPGCRRLPSNRSSHRRRHDFARMLEYARCAYVSRYAGILDAGTIERQTFRSLLLLTDRLRLSITFTLPLWEERRLSDVNNYGSPGIIADRP